MTNTNTQTLKKKNWKLVDILFVSIIPIALIAYAIYYGPAYMAVWNYSPQQGDVLFQSLPHNRLVDAIEGVTESPYSHCGIVAKENDQWIVYEALGKVKTTPLKEFLFRGRGQGFAVYRLKDKHKKHITQTLKETKTFLGRPYDIQYQLDEEKIYCSELIYKAYQQTTGEQLGTLIPLGELNWQPFEKTIIYFEKGPVPLDRQMITPKHLADAEQLELVSSFNIDR